MAGLHAPPWRVDVPEWARAIERGARVVTLDVETARLVGELGAARHLIGAAQGRRPRPGFTADSDDRSHRIGALGEYAVARVFGLPWNTSLGVLGRFDVGPLQVRTRTVAHYGLNIGNGSDKPDDPFVLVLADAAPTLVVHGWLWGREVLGVSEFRREHNGAVFYAAPQEALRPLDELEAVFPELQFAPAYRRK